MSDLAAIRARQAVRAETESGSAVDDIDALLALLDEARETLEAAQRRIAELESEKPHPRWGWASD